MLVESQALFRVQLKRNLPKQLQTHRKYQIQVYLSSEFHEIVEYPSSIRYSLHITEGRNNINLDSEKLLVTPNITAIRFILPSLPDGNYRISIEGTDEKGSIWILPFISDFFCLIREPSSSNALPSLQNYRLICPPIHLEHSSSFELTMKEEYGLTIGSHVYDSSVVLIWYLHSLFFLSNSTITNASILVKEDNSFSTFILELGAGCGLVSAYCMKYLHCFALISDRKEQLPILTENIQLNNHSLDQCDIFEFDWANADQLRQISEKVADLKRLSWIFAADVLYDTSSIDQFCSILVHLLLVSKESKALIAQKNRKNGTITELQEDLSQRCCKIITQAEEANYLLCRHHQLKITCVFMMCDVLLWEISWFPI